MTSLHEATKTDLSPDFSGFGDKTKYVSKFLQFPRTVHLVKRHGFFKFVTFTTLQSKPVHIKQACVSHAGLQELQPSNSALTAPVFTDSRGF